MKRGFRSDAEAGLVEVETAVEEDMARRSGGGSGAAGCGELLGKEEVGRKRERGGRGERAEKAELSKKDAIVMEDFHFQVVSRSVDMRILSL